MRETIVTNDGKEYSVDEIVHSTRIQRVQHQRVRLIGISNGLLVSGY